MSDEPSHRLYRRTAWILAAVWFAVALIAVLLFKTPAAYAGFAIVTILCLLMVLTGSGASPRVVGFGILMLAAVIAIVAEFAGPDWPMDGAALATLAVTAGAFGVGQVFWSRRHGAPEPWIENWAGWMALAGLLGFAVAAVLVRLDYVTSPTALVGVEGVAALAELAGKRWMVRLSLAAIVAAVTLLSSLRPELPAQALSWLQGARDWMSAQQLWSVVLPPGIWLLFCLKSRPGWSATWTGFAFVALVAWISRDLWILTGLFKN